MISLHVYLTPKIGQEKALESAIRDKWMPAMAEQPGFVSAAVVEPFSEAELAKLEAAKPESAYECVAFWQSESKRLAWVGRPIHDQVFSQVLNASDGVSYTVQTVKESWSL